jgi:tetratricopeptide (TPR) repeat protein
MEKKFMDCEQIEREDMAEKYLAGRLDKAEREEFEAHCAGCPVCLEKLEIVRTLQSELWEQSREAAPVAAEKRPAWSGRWVTAAAAGVLIIALGLVLWWRLGPARGRGISGSGTGVDIASLGAFEPPAYLPPPALRGPADEAGEYFERGMEFYQQGDYSQAIPDLASAVRINPQGANGRFFLGVCFLLTGQNKRGIFELTKTIALGDPAYAGEAHFYLGKAYLRQKDIKRARQELQAVVEAGGRLSEEAARLLKLIEL